MRALSPRLSRGTCDRDAGARDARGAESREWQDTAARQLAAPVTRSSLADTHAFGWAPGARGNTTCSTTDLGSIVHSGRLTRRRPGRPSADLAVAVTWAPHPVTIGAALTYTITVTNLGPADSTSFWLTEQRLQDQIRRGTRLELVDFSSADGLCSGGGGGNVACVFERLAAGTSLTATLVARSGQATTLTSEWHVAPEFLDQGTEDPNLGNNTAVVVTSVIARLRI